MFFACIQGNRISNHPYLRCRYLSSLPCTMHICVVSFFFLNFVAFLFLLVIVKSVCAVKERTLIVRDAIADAYKVVIDRV